MNNNISIRALHPNEWSLFRSIRLKALQMHQGNFSARYESHEKEPDSFWQDLLNGQGKQIFGLFDHGTLIGITSVFEEDLVDGRKLGSLHMSFIEPIYRGYNLSRLMYEARIKWAKEHGIQSLYVSHRENNEASRKAMLNFGFELVRKDEIEWPDGQKAMDYIYKLDL